jgi:hypothetical protein
VKAAPFPVLLAAGCGAAGAAHDRAKSPPTFPCESRSGWE